MLEWREWGWFTKNLKEIPKIILSSSVVRPKFVLSYEVKISQAYPKF